MLWLFASVTRFRIRGQSCEIDIDCIVEMCVTSEANQVHPYIQSTQLVDHKFIIYDYHL